MTVSSVRPARFELLRAPLTVGAAGLAAAVLLRVRDPHEAGSYGYCPFLLITGRPCPGCGGLRAGNDLAHGDIVAAVSSNLLAVATAATLVVLWVVWMTRRWRGSPSGMLRFNARTGYALVAVAVVFGIVRNTPWGSWLAP